MNYPAARWRGITPSDRTFKQFKLVRVDFNILSFPSLIPNVFANRRFGLSSSDRIDEIASPQTHLPKAFSSLLSSVGILREQWCSLSSARCFWAGSWVRIEWENTHDPCRCQFRENACRIAWRSQGRFAWLFRQPVLRLPPDGTWSGRRRDRWDS